MTDNEIIKVLQEMADYPHYYEEGQMLMNALALINRLKAENEDLSQRLDAAIAGQETLQKYINRSI